MTYLGIIIQYLEGVNPNFSSIMRQKGGTKMTEKQIRDALDTAIYLADQYEESDSKTFRDYLEDRGLKKLSKQEFCRRMKRDLGA